MVLFVIMGLSSHKKALAEDEGRRGVATHAPVLRNRPAAPFSNPFCWEAKGVGVICHLARKFIGDVDSAAGGVSIGTWRPGHRRAGPARRLGQERPLRT